MANVEQHLQMWEAFSGKNKTKTVKALSKDDYEFLELKDEHGNKFEVKFYPEFYMEDK